MAVEIIGRREELLAFDRFLEAVPAGEQALLLEGDAGIGKTALWQEGNRLARERGFRVLTSRSAHSETQIAFATVGDVFAPVVEETLPRLTPVQRRALETALLLREPDGPPPDVRLLGLALLSVMRALAEDGPVLVGLDDLQWVDASSAEVLMFMLRRLEDEPVGVCATVRGRPVAVPLELDKAFGECRRVAVEPLSVGAIHRLLWGRLALNLPRPTLVRVYEAVGGNPFYALELGRALLDGDVHPEVGPIALPASLETLVAGRLRRLSAPVRETLAAVAAVAAPTVTLLEPLSASAVDDIERAHARGVLELDGDRIRFAHPLLAPTCYNGMPLHRRRLLHRRLAELRVDLEERARHLAIAATDPDEEVARALEAGASHARARGAALVAAELSELAVELTPQDRVEEVVRRRITAGEHAMHAGDATKALDLLTEAVSSAQPGAVRAQALSQLAWVHWEKSGFPAAEDVLSRALAEPGVDIGEKVSILGRLAWLAASSELGVDGIRYAEAGLELAEQAADPELLVASLSIVAELTFWRTGRIRRDLLDRAIELGRDGGNDEEARATLARLLARSDRFENARAIWEELVADGMKLGDPDVVTPLMFLARLEVAAGAWDAAVRHCTEAIELARQTGRERVELLCEMVLAEVDAFRGDAERARTAIPELMGLAEGSGYGGARHRLARALGSLELSCGDAAASRRVVAPLFAELTELDEVLAQLAGSVAVEALVGTGDLPGAERLLALLDARAAGSDSALRPLADRARGLLLAARGDPEAAMRALERAAEQPNPPQEVNPLELGRTLLALGTVQRQAQHKRDARVTLEQAEVAFERLGASLWAERARSELRRIGGRTASESELSETERRIVELVVAGHRNREVAAELNLSPNTVVWNLSKVYRKLGVSSRTELAARIAATPQG